MHRLIRSLAAVLLLALTGQAAGSLSAGAQSPPSPPRQGVTPDEIHIGMSAAFTGASRSLGQELYRGSMAYFAEVNRTGGIAGRRIRLTALDDGYRPELAVKNTLRLMREEQVFLLFGYVGTPTVTRVLPLLKKYGDSNFFLFFPFTGAQPQREPPYAELAYNLRASYRQETAGLVENLAAAGRSRIAVFYQADAYGRSGWVGVREALARRGLRMAGEATYARGTKFTDSLDPQVALVQEATPDAVISIGSYAACAAFIRDARKAGLDVPIANVSFVGSESMVSLLAEAGRADGRDYTRDLITSQVVPSYESLDMPAVREYRGLIDRHDPQPPPGISDPDYTPLHYSFVSMEGFLNAKLLVEVLRRMGREPARDATAPTMAGLEGFDLGMGRAVSFAGGRNQGSDAVYYTTVKDGRFVTIGNWKEWAK